MIDPKPPGIPLSMAHLPTVGGLAVPWITARTGDGRHLFGAVDADRKDQALLRRLCGVCGRRHDERLVLLMRLSDLPRQSTAEPALHPTCTAYTIAAYPMVGGRLDHYRTTPQVLDSTMIPPADSPAPRPTRRPAGARPPSPGSPSGYAATRSSPITAPSPPPTPAAHRCGFAPST